MSGKKVAVSAFGLLLGLGLNLAHAEQANYYECQGKDIALNFYDKSSINQTTWLDLRIGKTNYTADDTSLESHPSVMGKVKSLVIKFHPDLDIKKASFIIPSINLGTNFAGNFTGSAKFKSQLVITTIATPFIAGPYIGVVNASKYYDINCKALLVPVVMPLNVPQYK
jgi:hypothetical protein